MRVSIVLAELTLLGLFPVETQADEQTGRSDEDRSTNLLALEFGLDAGMVGFKYMKQPTASPVLLGVGVNIEGTAPQAGVSLLQVKRWDLYGKASVLVSTWHSVIFSKGSVVPGIGLGLHRWPTESCRIGLYMNLGLGFFSQIKGESEGGGELRGIMPDIQVGLSVDATPGLRSRR